MVCFRCGETEGVAVVVEKALLWRMALLLGDGRGFRCGTEGVVLVVKRKLLFLGDGRRCSCETKRSASYL